MEISALKIFAAVAESHSLAGAAQQLDYSPSNVTARMQQLEAELGVPLFYRKPRGVALTPAGRTLLGYTERVLRLLDEARVAVQEDNVPRGALILGAMETTAAVRLPPILAAYHHAHPHVELKLSTGPSEELLSNVLSYQLDGAFIGGPVAHPEIVQELAFTEELLFIGSRQRAASQGAHETLLVFRRGCSYRARLEQLLYERGSLPFRVMEFGSLDAILGCVAAGMGVSLLPRSVLSHAHHMQELILHSDRYPPIVMPTMFIHRSDTLRTRAMAAFVDALRGTAQNSSVM